MKGRKTEWEELGKGNCKKRGGDRKRKKRKKKTTSITMEITNAIPETQFTLVSDAPTCDSTRRN